MKKQFLDKNQMINLQNLGVNTNNASIKIGKIIECQSDSWYQNNKFDITVTENPDNDNDLNQFTLNYKSFSIGDLFDLIPSNIISSFTKGNKYEFIYNKTTNTISYQRFIKFNNHDNEGYIEDIKEICPDLYITIKNNLLIDALYNMIIKLLEYQIELNIL